MKFTLRRAWFAAWFALIASSVTILAREWTGWSDFFAVRPEFRDVVEHLDLELDLRAPPLLAGKARLRLREGTQGRIRLLLNRALDVERATDETGRELHWEDEGRLRSDYHTEARVVAIDLPGPARELVLEYAGRGMDGSEERDWMGVLLLAPDELRMSKQTVFYPQIPIDVDGPGPTPWPARLALLAPEGFEAYAPGRPCEWPDAPAGGRAWCWEADTPTVLSLFAAERVRRETLLGDARVLTLLAAEHADLGESIAREAEAMLRFYAGVWGPIGARTLGIIEMKSRGDSYNWTSEGIIAMESGALSGGVPVQTLAHEIAHLWWGQEVSARGRGERFLTEGLAEFAAWRFLASVQDGAAAEEQAFDAEQRWWQSVHDTGVDPALFDVRFGTKGYTELAYAKGPMALWRLQRRLGAERMDAVLRSYGERMRAAEEGADSAGVFVAALREHGGELELDLALLEREGHVHAALADVVLEGLSARGRARIERCPAGIPAPPITRLILAAHTESTVMRQDLVLDDELGAPFEIVATDVIQAVRIDPDGELAGPRAPPVLRAGIGLQSSEPGDGATEVALGPFVVRLRFGAPLSEPSPGFAERTQERCTASAGAGKTAYFAVRSVALEDGGRTLALALADTEPGREHVLVLPEGLETVHGIPLPTARLRFTTRSAEGLPRPRTVAFEPADGARDVPASLPQFRIVFSEPMRIGRGFQSSLVDELEAAGWAYPPLGESRWEDPTTLIWELAAPLEKGKRYGLPFGYHYRSQLGISIERVDLRFETAR